MLDIDRILLPVELHDRLLSTVVGAHPRKTFGYLITDRGPDQPTDFIQFEENLRNHDEWRDGFESRGQYFVEHPDAGFVASPEESWRIVKILRGRGMHEIAVFHTHRRHPGNFSGIDYDLHVARFGGSLWHMIISLRNLRLPQVRAFAVASEGVRELEVNLVEEVLVERVTDPAEHGGASPEGVRDVPVASATPRANGGERGGH